MNQYDKPNLYSSFSHKLFGRIIPYGWDCKYPMSVHLSQLNILLFGFFHTMVLQIPYTLREHIQCRHFKTFVIGYLYTTFEVLNKKTLYEKDFFWIPFRYLVYTLVSSEHVEEVSFVQVTCCYCVMCHNF
mgnify:FL=1